MVHVLRQVQFLPIAVNAAWDFFSRSENLNEITPPDLNIDVRSSVPGHVYPGLMIRYKVTPFAGIKVGWLTEITHIREPYFFVDEQRTGPFTLWHHEHHFKEVSGGVEMTDIVHYKLPFGWLGNLVHPLVAAKLRHIFDFRKVALEKRFGK
jgi:ligand-binding SRPBCC domain-containing protein